jgi:hypothetical protein
VAIAQAKMRPSGNEAGSRERHALLVQTMEGIFMSTSERNESFSAKLPTDDPRTTGKPIRRGRIIWLGWAKETDPIYKGGWNFLSSKFLNPRSAQQSEKSPQPSSERCSEGQGVSRTGLWYWL